MKKFIWIAVGAVIVVGGVFFSGMQYGKSSARIPGAGMERFAGGLGSVRGGQQGIGAVSGDILSKDATSITVKLRDGGSKIVFFSDTTEISRFASGSASDLLVGKSVMVNGKTNTDGSVTAQSIQLRPAIAGGAERNIDR
jgi:hypothetical protein